MTENDSPLSVRSLTKSFPSFLLDDISFELEPGTITGLIGRNGAGKTTALNCIMGFTHPDSGSVRVFGDIPAQNAARVKGCIGFISAGMTFYTSRKLGLITSVTRTFYPEWDDRAYKGYMSRFGLDEEKTPATLSNGMKLKYALTLALSHGARLLILDEPTSGLDPVSRDEFIEILLSERDLGITVLFSTHITSDLEKCADRILFLQNGHLTADRPLNVFADDYRMADIRNEIPPAIRELNLGMCRVRDGWTVLIPTADSHSLGIPVRKPTLDEIITHLDRESTTFSSRGPSSGLLEENKR